MSTANIPNKSLRKTANLRISEDCISVFLKVKFTNACLVPIATFFKHGFQISKHVRACRHVKLGPGEVWHHAGLL